MIERLDLAFNQAAGKRFYLLYGVGAGDAFIDQDFREKSIEEVLFQELRARAALIELSLCHPIVPFISWMNNPEN